MKNPGASSPAMRTCLIKRVALPSTQISKEDIVTVEEPLEIRVEGNPLAVIMRTPGHDRELAAGFLLTEGIIRSARDLFDVSTCVNTKDSSAVDAALANPAGFNPAKFSRHVMTSASCGICGKTSIDLALKKRAPLDDTVRVEPGIILALPRRLGSMQSAFRATGGIHACGLFDATGRLLSIHEDVGRHNALDKLIGRALLEGSTPLVGHIVLLSGRASFEMIQKAHAAGIPIVAAIGAPSSLAVEFARAAGVTLCGFVRGRTMNLYAHPERIVRQPRSRRPRAAQGSEKK
jgi:FdhD protein